MRQSKAQIYLHCVWAVSNRRPLLVDAIEREVYRCIQDETTKLGCDLLAIDGMPDNVHLVVKLPTRLSVAELMKQVKGVSSRFIHDQLAGYEALYWQEGYGVFSVTPNHVAKVKAYVQRQKEHHSGNDLHAAWEEIDEEYTPK
jgi:putative transposase